VTVFKEVSKEEFDKIREVIRHFIESRNWERVYHLKNLDEDRGVKNLIEFFEINSTIKGSVDNATIYVISIYYYDPDFDSGDVYVASLVVERDASGYTVRISHRFLKHFKVFIREVAERVVGGIMRLIEKAVSTKHPLTTKLAMIAGCQEGALTIDLLYEIYGDEILNDEETISGIYSVCSDETKFFVNDKVIAIPGIRLLVVRDIRNDKIFIYSYETLVFHEVSSDKKIFYDALFRGYRDLLKPEFLVSRWGYEYALSSTEAVVDEKKVALVAYGRYDAKDRKWYIYNVFAITCDGTKKDKCSVYSFRQRYIFEDIDVVEKKVFSEFREAILGHILRSRRIHGETKGHATKDIAEKHTWEILPA